MSAHSIYQEQILKVIKNLGPMIEFLYLKWGGQKMGGQDQSKSKLQTSEKQT